MKETLNQSSSFMQLMQLRSQVHMVVKLDRFNHIIFSKYPSSHNTQHRGNDHYTASLLLLWIVLNKVTCCKVTESKPNQSNRRPAEQWHFCPTVSVLCALALSRLTCVQSGHKLHRFMYINNFTISRLNKSNNYFFVLKVYF